MAENQTAGRRPSPMGDAPRLALSLLPALAAALVLTLLLPGAFAFSGRLRGPALLNGIINEIGGAALQQPAMFHGLKWRAERAARRPAD